jgi:hypothetical protein
LPASAAAALFEQSAGHLWVEGAKIIGNSDSHTFLRQAGGTAVVEGLTIWSGDTTAMTQMRPSRFDTERDKQLKIDSDLIAQELRTLAANHPAPTDSSPDHWKKNSDAINAEFKGTLAGDTRDLLLVMEARVHPDLTSQEFSPRTGAVNFTRGREEVLIGSFDSPNAVSDAAAYFDLLSTRLMQ